MMPSFNSINYSLRPNKAIERALAFEGIRMLQGAMELRDALYVGFGSIWFTDFQIAHKTLGICDMISLEANEIGYKRATFNKPIRTIEVRHALSNDALPEMVDDENLRRRPWIIWLDYDYHLKEESIDDIRLLVERAPQNSVLLTTFSASKSPSAYGRPNNRPAMIRTLFGNVVPDGLTRDACDDGLAETLASLCLDFMVATAASSARPGGFIPAFKLVYTDTATMVTVGGVLPARGAVPAVRATVEAPAWPAFKDKVIFAPHLTLREAAALQARLPSSRALSRRNVRSLGFDLEQDQVETFQEYYKHYPNFAQISF